MSELIDLSTAEIDAAVDAMRKVVKGLITTDDRNLVIEAVAAINRIREGDPVGTVRRDPATGQVAIRLDGVQCPLMDCDNGFYEGLTWHYVDSDGTPRHTRGDNCPSARDITSRWQVIYTPGGRR